MTDILNDLEFHHEKRPPDYDMLVWLLIIACLVLYFFFKERAVEIVSKIFQYIPE